MTTNPRDRRYSREHEWAQADGGVATVGITHYAQDQLGDVVFLNLPAVGSQVGQFQVMGEVESVKSVSDLYSPVSGEVVETNGQLADHPEWINEDPYGRAWMVRVRLDSSSEMDAMMTAEEYEAFLEGLGH